MGGTKIEGIALASDGGEIARLRVATPRDDYPGTVAAVAGVVEELERETGLTGSVGVGIPGALSPVTGRVKNANSTWVNGRALDRDLGRALGRPVRLANDANCFALSESVDGAAAGASPVFGVILGTGVGGGVVIDGRLLEGASRIAGEWGHNPLPAPRDDERPGPPCYCGRRGCVETFLSGPGMAADHRAATGYEADAETIVAAAVRGDADAARTLGRYVERLGRALAVVVNLLDPEVVVLGGGVSNTPGLAARVQEALRPHVFSDEVAARVVCHRHGDSSGVRGAAWLWPADGRVG